MGGGNFQGEGQKKILLCKGGHYMKNKNIWGMCFVDSPDQQKKNPMQKCAKHAKNYQLFQKIFLARFAHSTFSKIHISGADNRHVPVQYATYVFLFFFCFVFVFFF